MAYEKFSLNFTLIYRRVYEMITNQFIPIPVAAHLTHFYASNLSLSDITDVLILQISFHYNFFFLLILKTCLLKKLSLYIERKRI